MPARAVPPSAEVSGYRDFLASRDAVSAAAGEIMRIEEEVARYVRTALAGGKPALPRDIEFSSVSWGFERVGVRITLVQALRRELDVFAPRPAYDLVDPERFLRYVGSLEPEILERDPAILDFLRELPAALAQRVVCAYPLSVPDDRLLNVFGTYRALSEEYARLGIPAAMAALDAVVESARAKELVEKAGIIRSRMRIAGLVHDVRANLPRLKARPEGAKPAESYRKLSREIFGAIESLLREGTRMDDAIEFLAVAASFVELLASRLKAEAPGSSLHRAVLEAAECCRFLKATVRDVA